MLSMSGCGAEPKPGADLAGTWGGIYSWNAGRSYAVKLVSDPASIVGTEVVTFQAKESVNGCEEIKVEGRFLPKSRKVVLDEVATDCADFILDGLYDGLLDAKKPIMRLVWSREADGVESRSGTLELTKLSEPDRTA